VVVWIAARPTLPDDVRVKVEGRTVKVDMVDPDASRGALRYSFDFDGDGTPDRSGPTPSATWIYGGVDHHEVTITIEDSRWHTRRILTRTFDLR
jgi:hypothetical protein